jgi:hypothetical protein
MERSEPTPLLFATTGSIRKLFVLILIGPFLLATDSCCTFCNLVEICTPQPPESLSATAMTDCNSNFKPLTLEAAKSTAFSGPRNTTVAISFLATYGTQDSQGLEGILTPILIEAWDSTSRMMFWVRLSTSEDYQTTLMPSRMGRHNMRRTTRCFSS